MAAIAPFIAGGKETKYIIHNKPGVDLIQTVVAVLNDMAAEVVALSRTNDDPESLDPDGRI